MPRPEVGVHEMGVSEVLAARRVQRKYNFIGFIFDADSGTRYDLIKLLGRGTFGRVYAATKSGAPAPEVAIKLFNPPRSRGESPFNDEVETEYGISVLMRRRLGEEFCAERVVCATRRFYVSVTQEPVIIFPHVHGLNLKQWLIAVQYRAMGDYTRALAERGFSTFSEVVIAIRNEQNQATTISAYDEAYPERRVELIRRLDDWKNYFVSLDRLFTRIQSGAMQFASQMLSTFDALTDANIYHSDIKPENMMVEFLAAEKRRLRLIDFGIGCAERLGTVDPLYDNNIGIFGCPLRYNQTILFQDPLAMSVFPGRDHATVRKYTTAYQVYAIGKVLQCLFDPEAMHRQAVWPVVQATPFMPVGLLKLIVDMTGEQNYRPAGHWSSGDPFRLSVEEVEHRRALFETRPTIKQACARFEQLYNVWKETSGLEEDSSGD